MYTYMYIFIRSSRRSKEGCGSAPRDSRRMLEDEAVAGEWPRRITRHEQTRLLIVLTKILYAPRDIVCTKILYALRDCHKTQHQVCSYSLGPLNGSPLSRQSCETVLRDSLARQSCAAQRQPSSERRAQPIPNTRAKYKKKSTKGIPFLGIKLWKRTPKF